MKMNVKISQFYNKFNNWINGLIAAGVTTVFSLGNTAGGLCSTGGCGSACGYRCAGFSVVALMIVGFKCRKKRKTNLTIDD